MRQLHTAQADFSDGGGDSATRDQGWLELEPPLVSLLQTPTFHGALASLLGEDFQVGAGIRKPPHDHPPFDMPSMAVMPVCQSDMGRAVVCLGGLPMGQQIRSGGDDRPSHYGLTEQRSAIPQGRHRPRQHPVHRPGHLAVGETVILLTSPLLSY